MFDKITINRRNKHAYILIGLLIVIGFIIFQYFKPYISSVLGAATLYVILKGQMAYLTERKKIKRGLSSTLLTLEALLFFLVPITGITLLVVDTISGISIDPTAIMNSITETIDLIEERVGFQIFTPENLSIVPRMGGNLLQSLGSGIYSLTINSIFMLFILYYMLFNYEEFDRMIREILPFKEENKKILAEETKSIIQANAIGIPVLGIIQGFFAYLGYMLFGVENAVLYAIITGFASIVPILGTTIVWIPIVVGIFLQGDYPNGIGLTIYSFFVIGGVDNVARLLLQKWMADIHPLITIFGVLIGIPMFGFWGVIFGPLILSLFVLFFNMYRYDNIPGTHARPRVSTKGKEGRNPFLRKRPS